MRCCMERGSRSHTVSGPNGLLSRNTAPGAAKRSTSARSTKPSWWQATKLAWRIRYGARIGSGPKRRCETVCAPDLWLSYTK